MSMNLNKIMVQDRQMPFVQRSVKICFNGELALVGCAVSQVMWRLCRVIATEQC